jgi:uroporphyrinogen-III synthase
MAIQSRLPAFLLTRPTAQSTRFAASLRKRFGEDLAIIISPLIAPRFLAASFPGTNPTALVFTSETGVEAFSRHQNRPSDLPQRAYCVGGRTAKVARLAGLVPISAQGDAADLIALILQDGARGPLLHICGAQTRGNVAQTLTGAGHPTTALILYEQEEQPLTPQAKALLSGERPVVVPLFSPRSATLFLAQVGCLGPPAPLICAALSQAVAEPLAGFDGLTLCLAAKPNAAALIDSLAVFFDAPHVP